MSIEAKIDDLIAAVTTNTVELAKNNAHLERVIAGQADAMAKLEGMKPAAGTRTRKPKDETPAAETPKTETKVETSKPAALPKDADELKAFVSAWTGGTDDAAERAERVNFLKAIAAELGVAPKFGELVGAEDGVKKTCFYINRKKEGLSVDFGHDYDFDGDPAQDAVGNEDAGGDSDFD